MFSALKILLFIIVLGTASKLIHLLHSTEFPYTTFAVLETGTCLVADSGFDSLMTKLKTFYTPRKGAKIEVKQYICLLPNHLHRRCDLYLFKIIALLSKEVLTFHPGQVTLEFLCSLTYGARKRIHNHIAELLTYLQCQNVNSI